MRGCAAKGLEPDKTLAWELVGFEVGFGTEARSADKIIARLLDPGNIPITIQR
jgi:hypothetical protein